MMEPVVELKSYIAIYIPSTIHVNEVADTEEWNRKFSLAFAQFFGGTTITHGQGAYLCQDGSLVYESVTIIKSFCTTDELNRFLPNVMSLIIEMGDCLSQESIALEINNRLTLVPCG